MSTCFKCQAIFPNHPIVEGKKRNFQRRKYCLDCSPFNLHNTKNLHRSSEGKSRTCGICTREYIYDPLKGHRTAICNSCNANRRRHRIKAKAVTYKGGRCVSCGYSKCLRGLGFHHRDPKAKEFNINYAYALRWEKVTQELDKCDLLCANCHMEEEDRRVAQSARADP